MSYVLVLFPFFSAACTLCIYFDSQHGSIYSGLYSRSLGYGLLFIFNIALVSV
jgi:hypothetical protein